MVLLNHQISSQKRPSSFIPPFPPPKIPKSSTSTSPAVARDVTNSDENCSRRSEMQDDVETLVEKMVKVLTEAGCTLVNPIGPPCLPSERGKFCRHLDAVFSSSANGCSARSDFVAEIKVESTN